MNAPFETMNAEVDQPTIYPATVDARPRSAWRLTLVALALTMVLGAVGGGWLALYYAGRTAGSDAAAPIVDPKGIGAGASSGPGVVADPRVLPNPATTPATAVAVPLGSSDAATISARVSLLEERLARISLTAESASGNAAKAEAILVAFAARRALDRGLPLGPMEAQLRVRFGETQPNAVDSILSASARPVTLEELLQRLDAMRPVAMADDSAGWLTRMGHSLSSLVVIRSSDAPSPAPLRRFERAQRAIAGARVDQAIDEVAAMPGANNALVQQWLSDARRYNDARRALDLIETAAIVEPGQNRSADVVVPTVPGVQ